MLARILSGPDTGKYVSFDGNNYRNPNPEQWINTFKVIPYDFSWTGNTFQYSNLEVGVKGSWSNIGDGDSVVIFSSPHREWRAGTVQGLQAVGFGWRVCLTDGDYGPMSETYKFSPPSKAKPVTKGDQLADALLEASEYSGYITRTNLRALLIEHGVIQQTSYSFKVTIPDDESDMEEAYLSDLQDTVDSVWENVKIEVLHDPENL